MDLPGSSYITGFKIHLKQIHKNSQCRYPSWASTRWYWKTNKLFNSEKQPLAEPDARRNIHLPQTVWGTKMMDRRDQQRLRDYSINICLWDQKNRTQALLLWTGYTDIMWVGMCLIIETLSWKWNDLTWYRNVSTKVKQEGKTNLKYKYEHEQAFGLTIPVSIGPAPDSPGCSGCRQWNSWMNLGSRMLLLEIQEHSSGLQS